jgi:hypothetical protein
LKHILNNFSSSGSSGEVVSDCGQEAENAAVALKSESIVVGKLTFHSEEEAGDVAFAKISVIRRYLCNDALELPTERSFNYHYCQFLKAKNASDYMAKEIESLNKVLKW